MVKNTYFLGYYVTFCATHRCTITLAAHICFSEEINKPTSIASWETAIKKDIADKWKASLPTIEELEAELNKE